MKIKEKILMVLEKIKDSYAYFYITEKYHDLRCGIYWWFQRRTKGFDDRDIWNLNSATARFLIVRLKIFKDNLHSYPNDLTVELWQEKLQKMIDGFQTYLDEDGNFLVGDENYKKSMEALEIFKDYFFDLWD